MAQRGPRKITATSRVHIKRLIKRRLFMGLNLFIYGFNSAAEVPPSLGLHIFPWHLLVRDLSVVLWR